MSCSGHESTWDLHLVVNGSDRFPTATWTDARGATAQTAADELCAAPMTVGTVLLEGPRLAHVPEPQRRQILRHAHRLLKPGGRLCVSVGSRPDQYPRAYLEQAAWNCGFDAFVRFVAGRAMLTTPLRATTETPSVSILIPAYKPAHFGAALDSALAQTWPRGEIIVGDDSGADEIAALVAQRRDRVRDGWELRYLRHEPPLGGRGNYLRLFDEARGAYIKYLNDDDLLAPGCVERMAMVLGDHPGVTLVTSYRRLIDGDGNVLPDEAFNIPVLAHDGIIDGRALATHVLSRVTNLVGEPSTVMFRRADLADNRPHPMSYHDRSARRNGDMSMWTTLLARGDAAWFAAPLSSFRQHADQVQKSDVFLQEARLAWVELVQDARATGLLAPRYAKGVETSAPLETGATCRI